MGVEKMSEKENRYTFLGQTISREEQEFLQTLRKEEILTRMIPASLVTAATTHILIRKGIIKSHERFGSWPKVLLGFGSGLALGKAGYLTTKCQRIVEEMPNSTLSFVVRKQLGNEKICALSPEEAL